MKSTVPLIFQDILLPGLPEVVVYIFRPRHMINYKTIMDIQGPLDVLDDF